MDTFENFVASHDQIRKQTLIAFPKEIKLIKQGIGLFIKAESLLDSLEPKYSTREDATRTILWRYVISIPSTAYMTLNSAIQGQYRIAYSSLRTLIEETVSIRFYVSDETRAFNLLNPKPGSRSIDHGIGAKFKGVDTNQKHPMRELYDAISERASHANALNTILGARTGKGGKIMRLEEPSLNNENFKFIADAVLTLLCVSLGHLAGYFPELRVGETMREELNQFGTDAERYIRK